MRGMLAQGLLALTTCLVMGFGVADARIVRSGGSSEASGGTCDEGSSGGGGGTVQLAVFNEDGSGAPGTIIPDTLNGYVYVLPEQPCPGGPSYRFLEGEVFEFEGSASGVAADLLAADDLAVSFEWQIGGFSFVSDTITPTFEIPPSLFETEGRLDLTVIATFKPVDGKAFWFCGRPVCTDALFEAATEELTFTGLAASVEFGSAVPLPPGALLMLTALGGGAAWKRRKRLVG